MPSYATTSDMLARFDEAELIQLTDDEATGSLNVARLTRSLDQADNLIDASVGAFYKRIDASLPVPPLLTDLACEIAHFKLYRRANAPEGVAKAYDKAVQTLRDLAKGVMKLDQGEEAYAERDGQVLVQSSERLLSRESMKGF